MYSATDGTPLHRYMAEKLGTSATDAAELRSHEDVEQEAARNNAARSRTEQNRNDWRTFLKLYPTDGTLDAPSLSALREQLGFSQRELGNVLGLSEAVIASAEQAKDVGFATPTLTRFVKAAQAAVEAKGAH